MFEAVRRNKRISQVILAIIILPFAFFGMDAYFSDSGAGPELAKVGDTTITAFEFDQAERQQQDRVRSMAGGEVNRRLFETPAFRRSVLENLINQRALTLFAQEQRLTVLPQQLQEVIASTSAFQRDGQFSREQYEQMVRAQGLNPALFEARLAQDLRQQQVVQAVGNSAFVGVTAARQFLLAQLEQRTVREVAFSAEQLGAEIVIDDAAVTAYYEKNAAMFELPSRLKAEYVILDEISQMGDQEITDEVVRQYYESQSERFGQPEERRARHILLQLPAAGSSESESDVKARAESLLAELKQDPSRFEELAREHSQDPGSARNGGDLGFFSRGMMVGSFEDAVFAMQKDEISDVVKSDFGFHIIQLIDIKAADRRPLEEVREQLVFELSRQAAARQFAAKAEDFANLVYEQPDSLAPAAEALKLEVRESEWITREGPNNGIFTDPRVVEALFADAAVQDKHNIQALELQRGTLVSARVKEFEAGGRQPIEEVREQIVAQLRKEAGEKAARQAGEALLAQLTADAQKADEQQWSEAQSVGRDHPSLGLPALHAIFSQSSKSLPAYFGAETPVGFSVFKLEKVERPELAADDERIAAVAQRYEELVAEQEMSAFIAALRDRYKVEVNEAAFRKAISNE